MQTSLYRHLTFFTAPRFSLLIIIKPPWQNRNFDTAALPFQPGRERPSGLFLENVLQLVGGIVDSFAGFVGSFLFLLVGSFFDGALCILYLGGGGALDRVAGDGSFSLDAVGSIAGGSRYLDRKSVV